MLLKPVRLSTRNPITIRRVSFPELQLYGEKFPGVNFPESGVSLRRNWGSAYAGILSQGMNTPVDTSDTNHPRIAASQLCPGNSSAVYQSPKS